MGGACSTNQETDPQAKANSKGIDNAMRKEKMAQDQQIKLLLLGAGESGKSTIFKQMKILHQSGYSNEERLNFRDDVHRNCMVCIQKLLSQAAKFGTDLGEHMAIAQDVESIDARTPLTSEVAAKISTLWGSDPIKQVFARASEFQIPDSTPYFLGDVQRFTSQDYLPTVEDILRVRVKTSGIIENKWQMEGSLFRMFDVGGQRSERRKWIHYFDNVTAVIFVAALSEYDQTLEEDGVTNRMHEALKLFEQICNSRHFVDTSMILFLNKKDLFEKKILVTSLRVCFPDYAGEQTAPVAGAYIESKFRERNQSKTKQVYIHHTCATNTDNIKFVFDSVKDIFIQASLKASGF